MMGERESRIQQQTMEMMMPALQAGLAFFFSQTQAAIAESLARIPKGDFEDEILTVEELAVRFKVKPAHIYDLVAKGRIPAHKFGDLLRFRMRDIFEATRVVEPPAVPKRRLRVAR